MLLLCAVLFEWEKMGEDGVCLSSAYETKWRDVRVVYIKQDRGDSKTGNVVSFDLIDSEKG